MIKQTMLAGVIDEAPESLVGVVGLHFHSNCHAESFVPLRETVRLLSYVLERVAGIIALKRTAAGRNYRRSTDREAAAVVVAPIPIDCVCTGGRNQPEGSHDNRNAAPPNTKDTSGNEHGVSQGVLVDLEF